MRIHSADSLREVAASSGHIGAVRCVQMNREGSILVTGGEDGTCRVWVVERPSIVTSFYDDLRPKGLDLGPHEDTNLVCVHVLCGHQAPVSCMHYSPDMDLLLSGADDGSLCLHSVRRGEFIRQVAPPCGVPVNVVFVARQGYLVAHSWSGLSLSLFGLNSARLAAIEAGARVDCFASNPSSDVLLCGGADGRVSVLQLSTLRLIRSLDASAELGGGVRCMCFADESCRSLLLGAGGAEGRLALCTNLTADPTEAASDAHL